MSKRVKKRGLMGLAMSNFIHAVTLPTSLSRLQAALTPVTGWRQWWSRQCEEIPDLPAYATVRIGQAVIVLGQEATRMRHQRVFICVERRAGGRGDDHHSAHWVGSRLIFTLVRIDASRVRLRLEHQGCQKDWPCYAATTARWRYYLSHSLKSYCRSGQGHPYQSGRVILASREAI